MGTCRKRKYIGATKGHAEILRPPSQAAEVLAVDTRQL